VIGRSTVSIKNAHDHQNEHDDEEGVLGSILPGLLAPEPLESG
jgi:hypothetical protein